MAAVVLGTFDLQRDDRDPLPAPGTTVDNTIIYGGRVRTVGQDGVPIAPQFVGVLQDLLVTLGFNVFAGLDASQHTRGIFGIHTEWAVRSFQAYASQGKVRVGNGSVPNHAPYAGGVYAWQSHNEFYETTFDSNSATFDGGGL